MCIQYTEYSVPKKHVRKYIYCKRLEINILLNKWYSVMMKEQQNIYQQISHFLQRYSIAKQGLRKDSKTPTINEQMSQSIKKNLYYNSLLICYPASL